TASDELGVEQVGHEVHDLEHIELDNQCRTNVDNIYALDDRVPAQPLAQIACYEGNVAAGAMSDGKSAIDYIGMPAVVFSDPEIASVGYTEKEAKEAGYNAKASKFPFASNGRALSLNDTDGFLKLITREEDDLVIGAQIVGPNASD